MADTAYIAGRHLRRRYPDMFTDGRGRVHPIRGSRGYSELEEHGGNVRRERERRLEDEEEAYRAGQSLAHAEQSYHELKGDIMAEGGIRPDQDYGYDAIPRDVYRPNGKPADELPLLLESRGWHFSDAEAMLAELRKRRRLMERAGRLKRA